MLNSRLSAPRPHKQKNFDKMRRRGERSEYYRRRISGPGEGWVASSCPELNEKQTSPRQNFLTISRGRPTPGVKKGMPPPVPANLSNPSALRHSFPFHPPTRVASYLPLSLIVPTFPSHPLRSLPLVFPSPHRQYK